ncbi:Cell number regulator 1 [Acorus calamus]|uniref:Cell number regulator 1 n=1 Tax=Acorus calamus TaxID=4465 RepID=A0AAV9D8E0_ACOCL|nr:Cell number regulator 1 [Acorus calamus]
MSKGPPDPPCSASYNSGPQAYGDASRTCPTVMSSSSMKCFITCCCPCITFGQIAEIVDKGTSSCGTSGALYALIMALLGCQCIYSCSYRSKLRLAGRKDEPRSHGATTDARRHDPLRCTCALGFKNAIVSWDDHFKVNLRLSGALYALIMAVTGCQCIYSCAYRTEMRRQYKLSETPCNDFLLHCFCESCALCQEYRELKNRGFDPQIGI